jgi:hypothetical protein
MAKAFYRYFFCEDQGSREGNAVAASERAARKRVATELGLAPESLSLEGVYAKNIATALEGLEASNRAEACWQSDDDGQD